MKITNKWLLKHGACAKGVEAFNNQKERDVIKIIKLLLKIKKYNWINWLIQESLNVDFFHKYCTYAKKIRIKESMFCNSNKENELKISKYGIKLLKEKSK